MKRRKITLEAVWAKCPECKKIIQRIGAYKKEELIGYCSGVNCKYCGVFKKPDLNKIEPIKLPFLVGSKTKRRHVRTWKAEDQE